MPRTILITGTSYGLGAALSDAVRQLGDVVVSVSRTRPANAEERWIEADLGDIASLVRVVEQAAELAPGPFDGVIMNAALADKSASQWTPEQVERHLRINAVSPFTLWSRMEEARLVGDPCNVVLMGSFLQNGNVRQPAYAMSKAALWSWMRSYTMNQPGNHPVSMNMVWPGRVDTPANPPRDLPPEDPNLFYPASRVADVVLGLLYQAPGGPRGTVIDMGRS